MLIGCCAHARWPALRCFGCLCAARNDMGAHKKRRCHWASGMWRRFFFLTFTVLAKGEKAKKKKPHIVVLLADNVGWGAVGFHKPPELPAREVHTPNLDSLSKAGVELDRHYTYKFCSPSRSSFLSGRLPYHVNTYNDDPTLPGAGVPVGMTLLPEVLKAQGYATHFAGKYHIGMASLSQNSPQARGFDTSLGYYHSNNNYYDARRGQGCGVAVDLFDGLSPSRLNGTEYEERLFCRRTVDAVRAHPRNRPMFAYHAFHTSCIGWNATTAAVSDGNLMPPLDWFEYFSFIDDPDRRANMAMLSFMDACVGRVVDALKDRRFWADTLLLWSSDNGGAVHLGGGSNAWPLRGGYQNNWEGGIRAPAFLAGGVVDVAKRELAALRGVDARVVSNKLEAVVHECDWYATFAALAGAPDVFDAKAAALGLPPVDSKDVWPALFRDAPSPRTEWPLTPPTETFGDVHTESVGGDAAYMLWPFKLIVSDKVAQAGWCGQIHPNTTLAWDSWNDFTNCSWAPPEKFGCLFDVLNDPSEYADISSQRPDLAADLYHRLLNASYFDPDRGVVDEDACILANASGWWQPWLP